ncbi:MAG TPA: thiamine phosphate synthase [Paludibacter sp.]|nr:thiamine phosphate synthase [Paludibacter sp.]
MPINKEIAKLHFITTDHPTISHAEQAIRAYEAGCKWVQLRMKDASEELIEQEAAKIVPVANAHNAILLINDHIEIVKKTGAHGVHLGKKDMCPSEARTILGDEYIIGGTSNTLEDIISLIEKGVDYVGLGPFRFTTTKKNLSPILGREGYEKILTGLLSEKQKIPVIAIGGILDTDIDGLMQTGIHGIALAGSIMKDDKIEENIQHYQGLINF